MLCLPPLYYSSHSPISPELELLLHGRPPTTTDNENPNFCDNLHLTSPGISSASSWPLQGKYPHTSPAPNTSVQAVQCVAFHETAPLTLNLPKSSNIASDNRQSLMNPTFQSQGSCRSNERFPLRVLVFKILGNAYLYQK